MQMEYTLSCVWSYVRYQSVARFVYMELTRDMRCHSKQFASQCIVLFLQRSHIPDVLPGNDEHMHRRLWVQVLKGVNLVILVHAGGRYLLLRDAAKDAILHPHALLKTW